MEYFNRILCVTYDELTDGDDPILTKVNYRNYTNRKKINIVQRGCNSRKALIEYNSLPDAVRNAFDERYPNALRDMKREVYRIILKHDSAAVDYYRRYDSPCLTDKLQDEYVLNAEVLNEMQRIEMYTRSQHSKCGFNRPKECWAIVCDACEQMRIEHGHSLPQNEVRLKEKFKAYKKNGYSAIISGKVGNQTARKIGPLEARILLKLKRSRVPVYTDAQIYEEFNEKAERYGVKVIKSLTSVRNFFNEPKVAPLWYAAVYGELKFKQKYSALLDTEKPSFRDSLWYSDGTKLNLYYRDEEGKMRSTSVYEVFDAYSEVFLGYDIAPGETFTSQYKAFRMAVEFAGVKPYEVVNDNQGGHKKLSAMGFFKKICSVHRNTMPYNGQSKTIESAFGRFQSQILHKIWHFTGQNITTKKLGSRPNLEFIEANAYALPSLEEVKAIYADCRKKWNEAAHPETGVSRIDMYRMSENPATSPIGKTDIVQMFWLRKEKPSTYTNDGIEFDLEKKTYKYDVYEESGLRKESFAMANTGREFYVLYDPQDMTLIELWKKTASGLVFVDYATPKIKFQRNIQERTHEANVLLNAQLANNKRTRMAMHIALEDFEMDTRIAAEFYGLSTPTPKGISKKEQEAMRNDYEHGRLVAPIDIPVAAEVEDEEEPMTVGQWEKAVSNMDITRICRKF